MEDTLTITLTPELKAMLADLTQTEGISTEGLVQAAVQDYLFIRQFRALRSQLMQKSQSSFTDDMVLATALTGKAVCIVTGDKDLLTLKKFGDIDILAPSEFEADEEQVDTD